MNDLRCCGFLLSIILLAACQTAQQAKEIKLLGFEEDVAKGKSIGPIEGSDCVFHILGYKLGGLPTLRTAVANARKGKQGSIGDAFGGSDGKIGSEIRYFNNVSVSHGGFDAVFFGKNCILVTAVGYK